MTHDRGGDNDPEAIGLAFQHQGSTFNNVYCHATTCLLDQN